MDSEEEQLLCDCGFIASSPSFSQGCSVQIECGYCCIVFLQGWADT